MGKSEEAEFLQGTEAPDALVKARAVALEGQKAYPNSVGGQRCRNIVASIEAPDFSLEGMSLDGPGRRSFAVHHKNLPKLYFRAYPVDLVKRITTSRDYNLLPQWQEVRALMDAVSPAARWKIALPETPEYREHRTFTDPPSLPKGSFVVAVSAREDFKASGNRILAVHFTVSDLVLLTRQEEDGGVDDPGNRCACAAFDIGRRARDGAGRRNPAKQRAHDIGEALRHELLVGIVPVVHHAIRHYGTEQRFNGRQQRDRHRRLEERLDILPGQRGNMRFGKALRDAAEFRADGFYGEVKQGYRGCAQHQRGYRARHAPLPALGPEENDGQRRRR